MSTHLTGAGDERLNLLSSSYGTPVLAAKRKRLENRPRLSVVVPVRHAYTQSFLGMSEQECAKGVLDYFTIFKGARDDDDDQNCP